MRGYRVTAPNFVAGIETDITPKGEIIVLAAPILRGQCLGKSMSWFREYADTKSWTVELLTLDDLQGTS
jgi:hypothetical protein